MPRRWKPPSIRPLVTGLCVLGVVSAVFSLGELKYLLLSRRATALVDSSTRVSTRSSPKGGQVVQLVQYHFREADGTPRQGSDQLAAYWLAPKAGDRVQVQYLAGRPGSQRLVGNGAKVMPALFILCIVGLLAVFVVLTLEKRNRTRRGRNHVEMPD